jgi:hypothetical protein
MSARLSVKSEHMLRHLGNHAELAAFSTPNRALPVPRRSGRELVHDPAGQRDRRGSCRLNVRGHRLDISCATAARRSQRSPDKQARLRSERVVEFGMPAGAATVIRCWAGRAACVRSALWGRAAVGDGDVLAQRRGVVGVVVGV